MPNTTGVVARDDAAVEFRRAGVDRDRMALRGIADLLHALGQQHLQDRAAIIGRAADQEIVGGLAPILLQPFDVGLEAAGGRDQRRGAHLGLAADRLLQLRREEHAVLDLRGRSPRHRRGCRRRAPRRCDRARSASRGRRRGRTSWCGRGSSVPPSEGCQRTPCSTIQFKMSLDSWIMKRASSSSVWPPVTSSKSFQNSSSV